MFKYHLDLALKGLRHRIGLTVMMIVAISFGIGILMTLMTVKYQRGKIPLPAKSHMVYKIQMDSREEEARPTSNPFRMVDLTYKDALNLMQSDDLSADKKLMLWKTGFILDIKDEGVNPINANAVVTYDSFFSMFDVPFQYGGPWSAKANTEAQMVIVLSKKTNDLLFNGENSVGKFVTVKGNDFKIVGVTGDWDLVNRFYDHSFTRNRFDDAFIPFELGIVSNLPRMGRGRCWPGERENQRAFLLTDIDGLMASECSWIHFWAEFESQEQADRYKEVLNTYVMDEKSRGRFPREVNNFVTSINQFMEIRGDGVVSGENVLGYAFFMVCLLNSIGILLARYISKSKEVSLRRALGASKRSIMFQHSIEVFIIAVVSGLIGIFFAELGLMAMKYNYVYVRDYAVTVEDIAPLFQLDWVMVSSSIGIAVFSAVIIGLYPIRKVCNINPASLLKGQ